jgi:hypothetical protein
MGFGTDIQGLSDVIAAIEAFSDEYGKKAQHGILEKVAKPLYEEIRNEYSSHSKTGNLVNSLTMSYEGGDCIVIRETAPYAVYLEDGTTAHWIEPVSATVLAWTEGGQTFFSKGHVVSGITAWHTFSRAMDHAESLIDNIWG